jgi:ubiquinone/menaquinone biosynthesis C-methylase UbiE
MPSSPAFRSSGPPRAGSGRRAPALTAILVLGAGLSLILYLHGTWWWYAPLAAVVIVPAHIAVLGAMAFAAAHVTQGWRAHGGKARRREGAGHSHQGESLLLHRPRQFDWMARVVTLGRDNELRQWTLDLADLQPDSKVVDIGCGTGTLLLMAAERIGPSGALHGIEPSPEMAAHARHKARARRVPLDVVEASADGVPYSPSSFDAVFCTLVFHHLPQSMQEDAIREMRRVLRPGGRAVIVDWQRPRSLAGAITSPLFLVYLLHSLGPDGPPLDAPRLERLMTELGFEGIARRSFGAGGVVGAVVGRLASGARSIDQAEPQEVRSDA